MKKVMIPTGKLIFSALFSMVLAVSACTNRSNEQTDTKIITDTTKNEVIDIPYTVAKNYFVRNDFDPSKLLTPKITTQESFDKLFGMATVMGKDGKPTPIDFTRQYAIAVILPAAERRIKLTVEALQQSNQQIILRYTEEDEGSSSTMKMQPFLLLIVDRQYGGHVVVEQM
ncbi:hypothetical protein [Olivibacter ginsenosidimutans]